MAEIPDRVPGGVILASYANQIRDRAAMRYADPTARDASNPLPIAGELAYINSLGELQVFDGATWERLVDASEIGLVDARLAIEENHLFSEYQVSQKTITTTPSGIGSVVTPVAGDYLCKAAGVVTWTAAATTSGRIVVVLEVDGLTQETWNIKTGQLGADILSELPINLEYPALAVPSGVSIEFLIDKTTASIESANIQNYWVRAQQVQDGLMTSA